MLRKETKQKAEEMAATLAPLFRKAQKLRDAAEKTREEATRARYVAKVWQYILSGWNDYDLRNAKMTEEEAKAAQKIRNEQPKEWAEILDNKYILSGVAETAEEVANINLINFNNFICKKIFLMIRPCWQLFRDKKGFKTLGEVLSSNGCAVSFSFDGCEVTTPRNDPNYYEYYFIYICNDFWSNRGECWATFYNSPKNTNEEEPEAPQLLTVKKYNKLKKQVKKLEANAKGLYKEQSEIFAKWGAIRYYLDKMEYIQTKKDARD